MFEHFTAEAKEAIRLARDQAAQSGNSAVETRHLLLAALKTNRILETRAPIPSLDHLEIRLSKLAPELAANKNPSGPGLSSLAQRALAKAAEIAEAADAPRSWNVTAEHLLVGAMLINPALGKVLNVKDPFLVMARPPDAWGNRGLRGWGASRLPGSRGWMI